MHLAAGDRVYSVYTDDGFTKPCAVFPLGTVLRGRVNHTMSASVDLVDESEDKLKAHRYWVRDVELVGTR
jgi:hypothetical protein